jgi:hypothetical protein
MTSYRHYRWVFEHLDELSLEDLIHIRVRLQLERYHPREADPSTAVGEIYHMIIPHLVTEFIFNDDYPFDYLRRLKALPRKWGTYHVYVLELHGEAIDECPYRFKYGAAGDELCVYVGETGKTVAQRITDHRAGWKSKDYITENLIQPLPLLYEMYNPLPSREESRRAEAALAEALHLIGCTVFGGH